MRNVPLNIALTNMAKSPNRLICPWVPKPLPGDLRNKKADLEHPSSIITSFEALVPLSNSPLLLGSQHPFPACFLL